MRNFAELFRSTAVSRLPIMGRRSEKETENVGLGR